MSNIQILKPAAGIKVRHPGGRHLAIEGEPVEVNSYWLRRIAAGDVVIEKKNKKTSQQAAGDGQNTGSNRE